MMRALSLHQPYASAIALNLKQFETRGRKTNVRGELAIHAAQCIHWFSILKDIQVESLMNSTPLWETLSKDTVWSKLPRGAVVALAKLAGCARAEHLNPSGALLSPLELAWGDWTPGRWGYLLEDVKPLKEPVACRGMQGFFFLPADVEEKVRCQI